MSCAGGARLRLQHAVAAAGLRAVQRLVGPPQQRRGVHAAVGGGRRADACRDAPVRALHVLDVEPCDRAPDTFSDVQRALRIGVGQRDDEFFAAVPCDVIAVAAQALRCGLRDAPEHVVAGRVAVVIVERLEVIHVDEQHRQRAAAARRTLRLLREHRVERAAVVEARQRIGVREPVQLRFGDLPALQLARQRQRPPRDEPGEQAH